MIPSNVIAKMAILGLTQEQAAAVSDMIVDVETATKREIMAVHEEREFEREAKAAERREKTGCANNVIAKPRGRLTHCHKM